jgi:predicted nucleic acid-binding protein
LIVLDASVILKWLVEEEGSGPALSYRDEHVTGVNAVAVPELFFYEAANVLATRSGLSAEESRLAFAAIWELELESYHLAAGDYLNTVRLSQKLDISGYDAAYVVLAEKLSTTLITADGKLARRCADLGFVQLLE